MLLAAVPGNSPPAGRKLLAPASSVRT